jgi:serine/threonine protein phosphatase PrpC
MTLEDLSGHSSDFGEEPVLPTEPINPQFFEQSAPKSDGTNQDVLLVRPQANLIGVIDGSRLYNGRALATFALKTFSASLKNTSMHSADDVVRVMQNAFYGTTALFSVMPDIQKAAASIVVAKTIEDVKEGKKLVIGWAGNSRAYGIGRNGSMIALTKDHTILEQEYPGLTDSAYMIERLPAGLSVADFRAKRKSIYNGLSYNLLQKIRKPEEAPYIMSFTVVNAEEYYGVLLGSKGLFQNLRPHIIQGSLKSLSLGRGETQEVVKELVLEAQKIARGTSLRATDDDISAVIMRHEETYTP